MKNFKLGHKILTVSLALLMLFTSFPVVNTYAAEDVNLGQVSAITEPSCAVVNDEDKSNITVIYNDSIVLDWTAADASIGRSSDGWWVGIKITAPEGMSVDELKSVKYETLYNGYDEWSDEKSFWNAQDSDINSEEEIERYITMWAFINEKVLNYAIYNDKYIDNCYKFDWDNDGIYEQEISFSIDANCVALNKDGEQVYSSSSLGNVEAITGADVMEVEGSAGNVVTVTNNGELTLQWSQADASIGRTSDGWWAGIKVTAPEGMSVDELKAVKYETLYNGYDEWSDEKSFWNAQDSDINSEEDIERYITMWAFINEDVLNNYSSVNNYYMFDWNADGVYEQFIGFSLNTENITLDKTNLYAMDNAAPIISELTDNEEYTNSDVTVEFSVIDEGTESNGVKYISGISGVYYSVKEIENVTIENISKLESAKVDENGKYKIIVSNETNNETNYYYIYAVDFSGNIAEDKVKILVDKTGPEFNEESLTIKDSDGAEFKITDWTNKGIKIEGYVSDNLSGIKSVEIKEAVDGATVDGATLEYDEDDSKYTLSINAQTYEGNIYLVCADKAGNETETSFCVKMDNTNCVIMSLSSNCNENEFTNKDVIVEGRVIDEHSGVERVEAVLEDGSTINSDVDENGNFKIDENGNFKITVFARSYEGQLTVNAYDNAGNGAKAAEGISSLSIDLYMDNEIPTVSVSDPVEEDVKWTNEDVTVSGTVTDNLSDIKAVYYAEENSIDELTIDELTLEYLEAKCSKANFNETENTYEFTIKNEDNYEGNYVIYAVDKAGNISEEKTVAVKMDITAPNDVKINYDGDNISVIEEILSNLFWFYQTSCKVTLSSTDNLSGIKSFEYSLDGGKTFTTIDKESDGNSYKFIESEKSAEASFSIDPQFREKVIASATDKAGNKSNDTIDDKTIVVDSKVPEITVEYTSQAGNANYVDKDNKSVEDLASAERVYYNNSVSATIIIEEENFFEGQVETVKDKDGNVVENRTVHEVGILVEKTIGDKITYIEYLPKNEEGAQQAERKYSDEYEVDYVEWSSNKTSYTTELEFNDDADYKLIVEYTDYSGNNADYKSKLITVDTTAPEIEITYGDEKSDDRVGEGYFLNRTATITVEEHNFDKSAFSAEITAKDIAGNTTISDTAAKKDLEANQWRDDGDTHTLVISYTDDANYTFALNGLEDFAGNNYLTNEKNEGSIYDKDAETPDSFVVDKEAPSDVVIDYSENHTVLETIRNIVFWFFNPSKDEENLGKCTVTLTTTDMTSGLQYFTYSYNGNYTDIHTENIEDENVAKEKGFKVNDSNPSEFTYIFEIPAQFRGKVTASATDNAGNKSNDTIDDKTIVVDSEAPEISVSYSKPANAAEDNSKGINYFSDDVTVTVTVNEENFMDGEYPEDVIDMNITADILGDDETETQESYVVENWTRDDTNQWVGSFTLSTEGDYTLSISYADKSGNEVSYSNSDYPITIDKTAPVVSVEYDNNNVSEKALNETYFNANRTATITVVEHNFAPEYLEDNISIIANSILTENDENEQISTKATEKLAEITDINNWNKEEENNTYTYKIDYTDDAIYDFALISFKDYAKNEMNPDNENKVIYADGTVSPESFVVDTEAPSDVVIDYSENHTVLETIRNIVFWFFNPSKDEENLGKCTVTLTTTDMTSGLQYFTYSYNGNYTDIDIQTENIEDKNVAKEKGFEVNDSNPSEFTYSFEIPAQFRGKVTASATDNAGNTTAKETESEKTIIVDSEAPEISVNYSDPANAAKDNSKGINYFSDDVTVTVTVNEENFMDGEYPEDVIDMNITADILGDDETETQESYVVENWTRDDTNQWVGSFTLSTEGDYTLSISYADKSGNEVSYSNSDYPITIDKTAPVVSVEFDSISPVHTIDGREYYDTNRSAIIKVTEHNFSPEYFDTEDILKALDILGNNVTNYNEYFKKEDNWETDTTDPTGNTHTIEVDFKSDANYTFDFDFVDLAKNNFVFTDDLNNSLNDYPAYLFTVDKTSPKNLSVSYSSNVFETVINAITFGYYDSIMKVTVSADDDTTGVYHIMYSYLTATGVSDVNAQLVNDAISKAEITRDGRTSTAVFSIPKSSLERNSQFNGTVEFTAYDYAENNTYEADTKRVIVDNISPTASITFNEPVQNVNNISYYAGDINATVSINEANFYSQDVEVTVTNNGSIYPVSVNWVDNSVDRHTGTFRITGDGDYIVKIAYSDRSGNDMVTYESNQLTIDTVDPVITVSGINHQSANNDETIGFNVSVTDKNIDVNAFKPELSAVIRNAAGELETIKISLGDPSISINDKGETVYTYTIQNLSVDGFYSLICSAVDYSNHSINIINSGQDNGTTSSEETLNFSVNREGSTFWIETTYNDKYTDNVFLNELDNAYANDKVEIIVHELNVDPVDISDNIDEQTVFAMYNGAETDYITLSEGTGSADNYVKNTLRGAGGWYETLYTLNNENGNFNDDGVYSFSILSFDRAGNSNLNTKSDSGVIKFTVDRTNPVITSNIYEDQIVEAESHTVEFEINDANPDVNTVEVSINGEVVPSESVINISGNIYNVEMSEGNKQSISITSKDLAGNPSEQYEISGITVSTSPLVLFYYSYTVVFWAIVAGILALAFLILLIVFKRKKDKDEEEA